MSQENVEKTETKTNDTSSSTVSATPSNKNEKAKKKTNPFLQMLLSLLTLGAYSRFSPRNKDKKGGWGVTVFLLLLICAGLVGERFYKQEINEMARQQLQIETDIIPQTLPFEKGGSEEEILKDEENTKKVEALTKEKEELISKLEEAKSKLASVNESKSENANVVAKLKSEIEKLELQAKELQVSLSDALAELETAKAALQQEKSKVPTINFSTINSASEEVGCKTSYSVERANDLFAKEYKGHWAEWTGFVKSSNKEQVEIVSKEDSNDVAVIKFEKEGAGYYLLKGQEITMRFILENNASCDQPFFGHTGFEIKE